MRSGEMRTYYRGLGAVGTGTPERRVASAALLHNRRHRARCVERGLACLRAAWSATFSGTPLRAFLGRDATLALAGLSRLASNATASLRMPRRCPRHLLLFPLPLLPPHDPHRLPRTLTALRPLSRATGAETAWREGTAAGSSAAGSWRGVWMIEYSIFSGASLTVAGSANTSPRLCDRRGN